MDLMVLRHVVLIMVFCSVITVNGQCQTDPELEGPKDTCAVTGQSANMSCKCMVSESRQSWHLKKPEDERPKAISLDDTVFIELNLYSVSFSPIDEEYRWCTLTVGPVTESLDGNDYTCTYDSYSSCATLYVAELQADKDSMNVTSSCTLDGDKLVVKAHVSGYTAKPGINLKLASDGEKLNFQTVHPVSEECQQETNTFQMWQVLASDVTESTLALKLQYQHITTGNTFNQLTEIECEVPVFSVLPGVGLFTQIVTTTTKPLDIVITKKEKSTD